MKEISRCILFTAVLFYAGLCHVAAAQEEDLRFAVTGAVASDPSYLNYRQLSEYLAGKVGRKAVLISGLSYSQVDNLFIDNKIDVGFVCNCDYARRKADVQFVPVAAPLIEGHARPTFRIYLIAPKDSPVKSLADLRGKSVDFADPLSTTSCYAADVLRKKRETIKSYFGKAVYSGSHDMTIKLVAKNMVDAGFIDGHIWEYHDAVDPVYTSKTKIIGQSQEFTLPPVVVGKNTPVGLKRQLRSALLNMHRDAAGRGILKKLRIAKFVDINDNDYQDVRIVYRAVRDLL